MSHSLILRFAGALVLPILLVSCASLRSGPPLSAEAVRKAADRDYHQQIHLGGRISVQYQGPDKEELLHGGFAWQQTPARTDISLLSPLGQTIALISVTPEGASLTQDGRVMQANDIDTLTAERLGWPFPVAGMREWLQGFAIDANGQRFVATPNNDHVTTANGWQIDYVAWQHNNAQPGQIRPRRVDLKRHTVQAGDVSIRIVIDSWQTR